MAFRPRLRGARAAEAALEGGDGVRAADWTAGNIDRAEGRESEIANGVK